jgi:hypothetical protein
MIIIAGGIPDVNLIFWFFLKNISEPHGIDWRYLTKKQAALYNKAANGGCRDETIYYDAN